MHYGHATNLIFCGGPGIQDFENYVTYFYLLLSFLLSYFIKNNSAFFGCIAI